MEDHSNHKMNHSHSEHEGHMDHESAGHDHDKHAGHNPAMFKQKFWLSLLLTVPVLYFSNTIQSLLNYTSPTFFGSEYISGIFGVIIFFYGGTVFLKSAKSELKNKAPGMMSLISLAISVAFVYSSMITLNIVSGKDFWWELASLVTIMLLGHWLEMASVMNAQGAMKELAKLLPDSAELVVKSGTKKVGLSSLKVGDVVMIRPGAKVPIDGVVIDGKSKINESMVTGESKPVSKEVKDVVIGGTINGSGAIRVKVTKTGDDTTIAGIMHLVAEAQKSKSKTQILADRAAYYLTFVAVGSAIIAASSWGFVGGVGTAFILERIVSVLIIACPHALGLAIPLVTSISTSKAANAGLLIKQRMALESARNIDVILFDKTGTLTTGDQGVVDVISDDKKEFLSIVSSIEKDSEHPIAKSIVAYAMEQKAPIQKVTSFNSIAGRGVEARIGKDKYFVGGPALLKEQQIKLSDEYKKTSEEASANGQSIIYLVKDAKIKGAIMISDVIRKESYEAVALLQESGKRVAMLTGDSHGVATWVAKELKLDEFFAEVLPENKSEVVQKLQKKGYKVAMVGDGVNDAPALTQADVGIAIGAGTDVAIESAGIVLLSNDPRGVSKIINLSKATYKKMVQNLIWATGYNALAIPLAAGVAWSAGFVLSPAVGAALMSLSTIIVAFNAQLLRRVKI